MEEYSIASKTWKLDPCDMCEIARNSVRQSGFPHKTKQSWIGNYYYLGSTLGNKPSHSHVSDIRVAYRFEIYHDEVQFLERSVPVSYPNPAASVHTLAHPHAVPHGPPRSRFRLCHGVSCLPVYPRPRLQTVSRFKRAIPTVEEEDAILEASCGLKRPEFRRRRHNSEFLHDNTILCGNGTGVVVRGRAGRPFCYRSLAGMLPEQGPG